MSAKTFKQENVSRQLILSVPAKIYLLLAERHLRSVRPEKLIIVKLLFILFLALAMVAPSLSASPTPSPAPKRASAQADKKAAPQLPSKALVDSANGWNYANGEWVHPQGYKFVNNRILRTTAQPGHAAPKPPGKLALANPDKLSASAISAVETSTKTAVDKAAEKARNLAPSRPPSQTGTHL